MAKVLITDDAAFMRRMLNSILMKSGHEVYEAVNGVDLLKQYEVYQPDIVTLDITMPEMDGITALKVLRAKYPNAKVVMCSAMGQQTMVIDAIQSGAMDFIVKPFEPSKVIEIVNKALSK